MIREIFAAFFRKYSLQHDSFVVDALLGAITW